MADSFKVALPMEKVIEMLYGGIVEGSVSGEQIDEYSVDTGCGRKVTVLVYEKHYFRVWNRLTLTVTLNNTEDGYTEVHAVSAGGGESYFIRFDWGAAGNFEMVPRKIFEKHILE